MPAHPKDKILRKTDGTYTVTLVFEGLSITDSAAVVANKDRIDPRLNPDDIVGQDGVQYR